jgi:SAM-dependent methyltransferase
MPSIHHKEQVMSSPALFDYSLLQRRFNHRQQRSRSRADSDFLYGHAAGELASRLSLVEREFETCVDQGSLGEDLSKAVRPLKQIHHLWRQGSQAFFSSPASPTPDCLSAPDLFPFREGSLDCVLSCLSLQMVNDLPGLLVQIRRALRPDGLFSGVMIGGQSLTLLRQCFLEAESLLGIPASPHIIPFVDVKVLGSLLQRAGFALPVVDVDSLDVGYGTVFNLMHDLRAMGMTNMLIERSRRPMRRQVLMTMAELYHLKAGRPDGRVTARFDLLYFSGWSPDASQQKPLQPGSARTSLKDVLE